MKLLGSPRSPGARAAARLEVPLLPTGHGDDLLASAMAAGHPSASSRGQRTPKSDRKATGNAGSSRRRVGVEVTEVAGAEGKSASAPQRASRAAKDAPARRHAPLSPAAPLVALAVPEGQDRKARSGIIPAAEFLVSTRVDGRPSRTRFPVLQTWRNEHVIFERPQGSQLPVVAAVDFQAPSQSSRASPIGEVPRQPAKRRRQASRAKGLGATPIAGPGKERPSTGAATQEPRKQVEEPLPRPTASEDAGLSLSGPSVPAAGLIQTAASSSTALAAPEQESGVLVQGGASLCGADAGVPTDSCGLELRAKGAGTPARREGLSAGAVAGLPSGGCLSASVVQLAAEVPTRPAACSLRSALRPRGAGPRGRAAGDPRRDPRAASGAVAFGSAEPAVVPIANVSADGDSLWYQGFAVECDRCDQPVRWGAEGSMLGAPGKSRFAQWQVLCNGCFSDRLFSEIGAWLVVGLMSAAEGDGNEPPQGWGVAREPVGSVLETLSRLELSGKPDQLSALLGQDAQMPGVRDEVFRRAMGSLDALFRDPGVEVEPSRGPRRARGGGGKRRAPARPKFGVFRRRPRRLHQAEAP